MTIIFCTLRRSMPRERKIPISRDLYLRKILSAYTRKTMIPNIEPKNIACEIVCVEPPSAKTFITVGLYCKTPYAPVIAMEKITEKKNSPYCFRLFLKSFLLTSLSVIPITIYLSCEVQQFVKKVFRLSSTHQFTEYNTVF